MADDDEDCRKGVYEFMRCVVVLKTAHQRIQLLLYGRLWVYYVSLVQVFISVPSASVY